MATSRPRRSASAVSVRPLDQRELVETSRGAAEFAATTNRLEGVICSTLYRTATNPRVLVLVERLVDREVPSRHIASNCFSAAFRTPSGHSCNRPATAIFCMPARI